MYMCNGQLVKGTTLPVGSFKEKSNLFSALPGVPKQAELLIFSTLRAKSVIFFTSLNKASSTEENVTNIVEFGWVIFILWQFLERRSFSNFTWFLQPMSVESYRENPFIWCFWESPLIHVNKRYSVSGNGHMKGHSRHNLRSSVAKIKQNLKITVFQEMGIESKLLNQIQWSWYHSLLWKMLYLINM